MHNVRLAGDGVKWQITQKSADHLVNPSPAEPAEPRQACTPNLVLR